MIFSNTLSIDFAGLKRIPRAVQKFFDPDYLMYPISKISFNNFQNSTESIKNILIIAVQILNHFV